MAPSGPDLIVLHEHPEWQKPLFAALERRGLSFLPFDVTRAAFSNVELPRARLYFNQASPSAYIRGHARRFRWRSPTCDRWRSMARGC